MRHERRPPEIRSRSHHAAIAVYLAFGDVVRGQTAVIASTLAGQDAGNERQLATQAAQRADGNSVRRDLTDFDAESRK